MTQEIKNQILTIINDSIDDINAYINDDFEVNKHDKIINISVNLIKETIEVYTLDDENYRLDNNIKECYYRLEDDIKNYETY